MKIKARPQQATAIFTVTGLEVIFLVHLQSFASKIFFD